MRTYCTFLREVSWGWDETIRVKHDTGPGLSLTWSVCHRSLSSSSSHFSLTVLGLPSTLTAFAASCMQGAPGWSLILDFSSCCRPTWLVNWGTQQIWPIAFSILDIGPCLRVKMWFQRSINRSSVLTFWPKRPCMWLFCHFSLSTVIVCFCLEGLQSHRGMKELALILWIRPLLCDRNPITTNLIKEEFYWNDTGACYEIQAELS